MNHLWSILKFIVFSVLDRLFLYICIYIVIIGYRKLRRLVIHQWVCGLSQRLNGRLRLCVQLVLQPILVRWSGSWLRQEWMLREWICLMEITHLTRKLLIWLKNIITSTKIMSLLSCLIPRQVSFVSKYIYRLSNINIEIHTIMI